MTSRPPLHVITSPRGLPLPPTVRSPARPQSARAPATAVPCHPRRPLSASRVQTTTAANAAFRSRAAPAGAAVLAPSAGSPHRRPASASRVRANYTTSTLTRRVDDESEEDDVDTIAIPVARVQLQPPQEAPDDDCVANELRDVEPLERHDHLPHDRAAIADAEGFLHAWLREEASFRSPLLFAEASFAQAKAMTARTWPQPNVFLSSVAFGALELFCQSLERTHPFLLDIVDALGMALFSNHRELQRSQLAPMGQCAARFLHYMQHGQFAFQQLHAHDEQLKVWQSAAHKAQRDAAQLSEKLQKQHVARLFDRVQARVKSAAAAAPGDSTQRHVKQEATPYPQLRHVLYGGPRGAHFDLQEDDYEFEPSCDEILLFFSSLSSREARKLLSLMQAKAAEMELPELGGLYAVAVDALSENDRRVFLREYFQLVASDELQDALRERDESNQEKQWQTFLDEMKDLLKVHDNVVRWRPGDASSPSQFHSDEARIGASVYDLVDLVEELAAEVSLAQGNKPLKLSAALVDRLKPFQTAKKKMEKARQLMMSLPECAPPVEAVPTCGCVCGKHRLISTEESDDEKVEHSTNADADDDQLLAARLLENANKKKASTSQRRPSSARGAKRKSTMYNVSARVSTRGLGTLRLFPLAEVCHIISSVVQLQFSREATDGPSSRRGSTRRRSLEVFDPLLVQRLSFKALAKDWLTRKYGIKSIAVMHMLQLEKSLIHYSATDKHLRCELFTWFVGADKTRSHYKDLGYFFFLRVAKAVIALLLKKSVDALTYADLIIGWTEQIGDADASVAAPKVLTGLQCVDISTMSFPACMKGSPNVASLLERLKCSSESVKLEDFFKRVLTAWDAQFTKIHAQVQESFLREADGDVDELDVSCFRKCVASCGLELTSGQLLEYFDCLTTEDGANVPMGKAVLFVVEHKYLQYT